MTTDQGNLSKKRSVKLKTQFFNPDTGHYIKREAEKGHILVVKQDGTKFKGVRVEKTIAKSNPKVTKEQALKAEKAVVNVLNKHKN